MCQHAEDTARLTDFEQEVLDVLREEGDVTEDPTRNRTLCELFGFANSCEDRLHRALRQLVKMGLVTERRGGRNVRLGTRRMRINTGDPVTYAAV